MAQLKQDAAGNIWDVSSGTPQLVRPAQGGGANVIVPAPAPKPELVPGHPNLAYHPDTNSATPVAGIPAPPPPEGPKPTPLPGHPGLALTGTPNHPVAVPIAGLPPEQDEASARRQSALEASRNLVQSIENAKKLVDGWSTGWGSLLKDVPGSEAAKLDAIINQEIRGNIFNQWVSSLKAQTDTGTSGIGRIMQSEIPLVTGALGALDARKMGAKGTMDSLNQIEARITRLAAMTNGDNPDDPKVIDKYQQQFLGTTEPDKEANAFIDSMVASGTPYKQALAQFQRQFPNAAPFAPRQYNDALAYQRKHPNEIGGYGSVTRSVPPSNPTGFRGSILGQGLSGANEGLADVLGAPADLSTAVINGATGGINALAGTNIPAIRNPFLGSDQIKGALRSIGSIYAPTADSTGQFARRVGESVGAAAVPVAGEATTLPRFGAQILSGLAGGIGGATAQRVFPGNPLAEAGGELLAGGLTAGGLTSAMRRNAQRQIEAAVPTIPQLKQQAGGLYRAAESRGVGASPQQTQQLADDIHSALVDEGRISPTGRITEAYPKAKEAVQLIQDYAGKPMLPTQMQAVRKVIGDGMASSEPAERRLSGILTSIFDDFANPIAPELKQGRDIASRYIVADQLERARELAGARASQFTGSGFENALRTEYRGLDRASINGTKRFNTDVNDAIETVARGTPTSNFFRGMGRLAPTGPVSGMGSILPAMGVGAATNPMTGGIVGGLLAGGGIAGRKIATNLGIRAADQAELIARNGGKLPRASLPPEWLDTLRRLGFTEGLKYLPDQNVTGQQ